MPVVADTTTVSFQTNHRFKRDRRELVVRFALSLVPGNIRQFEDLLVHMRPAQRTGHRPRITVNSIEVVVSTIGIRLQHSMPFCETLIGMLTVIGARESGRDTSNSPFRYDRRQAVNNDRQIPCCRAMTEA